MRAQFARMIQAPIEPQEIPACLALVPAPSKKRNLFTPENARLMAQRATEARTRYRAERLARLNDPLPEPVKPDENAIYVEKRIVQTRRQIESLDKRLERCKDAKDLKFIADSIFKLAELERVLSGRPAPGQFRPVKGKSETKQDRKTALQPLDGPASLEHAA